MTLEALVSNCQSARPGSPPRIKPGEREIQKRTFAFAARVLRMARALPNDVTGKIVARQPASCGTSIGANVEEAQGARSKADFARPMSIALSEARETPYWLRLTSTSGMVPPGRLHRIIRESEELVRILTAIVRSIRQKRGK